jgi:hypothetical protein
VRRDDRYGTTVKGNDGDGWSSDGVVLWLVSRQNRDDFFYSSGGWEWGGLGRVAGGDGADSKL